MGKPKRKPRVTKPVEPLVNAFAAAHGNYAQLGKFGDARNALVNRGGTPIARWKESGHISQTQDAAIAHCIDMWEALPGRPIVANYGSTIVQTSGTGQGIKQQEALDSLSRIKSYIPAVYWSVFEGVCRFDEPAGFAGSKLSKVSSEQAGHARLCVQFVADVIFMKERLSYR